MKLIIILPPDPNRVLWQWNVSHLNESHFQCRYFPQLDTVTHGAGFTGFFFVTTFASFPAFVLFNYAYDLINLCTLWMKQLNVMQCNVIPSVT